MTTNAQKEIPMDDAELDALMNELEAETAGMVATPAPAASTPAPAPAAVETVAVELNERGVVSTDDAVALAQADLIRAEEQREASELSEQEQELAALEAEMAAEAAEQSSSVPNKQPTVETNQEATQKVGAAAGSNPVLRAVPASEPVAEPEAEPNPRPAKKTPQLQFYLDIDQFKSDIAVSENNLDNVMMQHAGDFAYHAAQAARAEAQHARVKLRFDVVEAKLYDRHRKAIAVAGEKATEKAIENAVRQDPEWLQAKNLVIEAEMLADFNKGAVEALRHRKDMVVQLGADRREETKGQLRMSAHEDNKARGVAAVGRIA